MNKIKRYLFYVSKGFVVAFCCGLKVLVFIKYVIRKCLFNFINYDFFVLLFFRE